MGAADPACNTVGKPVDQAYTNVGLEEHNPAYNSPVPEISVTLKPAGADHSPQRSYILKISDNGAGLPQDIDLKHPQQLGLRLVARLTGQLDGVLEVDGARAGAGENDGSQNVAAIATGAPGSAFTITFPEAA